MEIKTFSSPTAWLPTKCFAMTTVQFVDVSATCGINQGARKSYGACFGDYDKDGFLDLFVANYTSSFDEYAFNELYRNEGDGTFEDVTESSGMFEVTGIQSFQGNGWTSMETNCSTFMS
jgi:hypothetical protein